MNVDLTGVNFTGNVGYQPIRYLPAFAKEVAHLDGMSEITSPPRADNFEASSRKPPCRHGAGFSCWMSWDGACLGSTKGQGVRDRAARRPPDESPQ